MRPVPVVAVKPSRQFGGSLFLGVVGAGLGPLAQARLNEALGLAVGLRRVRLGADVLEAKPVAGLAEGKGLVARPVVGHHPLDLDAQACMVSDRSLEEGHGASLPLALHDLIKGDPGASSMQT